MQGLGFLLGAGWSLFLIPFFPLHAAPILLLLVLAFIPLMLLRGDLDKPVLDFYGFEI